MQRQQTIERFRERLLELIDASGLSRSRFAARAGVDRSTLSQVLAPSGTRLPRVETVVALAVAEGVSVDWLLGLSEEGGYRTSVLQQTLEVRPGGLDPTEVLLAEWHVEALGYKIRHVPKSLPDLVKTREVLEYEYRQAATTSPERKRSSAQADLAYQRRPETDTEVCCPMQQLRGFARGEGLWGGLAPRSRRAQLERIATLVEELYPTYRWFLYDGRERFSVPLTVFGPRRAVIYFGQMYWVFNSTEHIRIASEHFDQLIRAATVQPTEVARVATNLLGEVT